MADLQKIVEELSLPIAGLMACSEPLVIIERLNSIKNLLRRFKKKQDDDDVLISLSFISLPVIPEIKITPRGLYDYNLNQFIDLFNR
jgi:adenine deaminase